MKRIKILSLVVIILIGMSCAIPVSPRSLKWREAYVKASPWLTPAVERAILNGDVIIGMTMDEVVGSRGRPQQVNRTVTAYGTSTQWVMRGFNYRYIYFENGKVTAWQNR